MSTKLLVIIRPLRVLKGIQGSQRQHSGENLFDQESNFVGGSGDTEDVGCGDDDDEGGLRLPTMSSSKLPDTPGMKLIAFRLCTRHKHEFLSEFPRIPFV